MLSERLRAKAVSKYYGAIGRLVPRGRANLAFLPGVPTAQDYSIVKVCAVLGYRLSPVANDRTRLCVSWLEDAVAPPASVLGGMRVLNARCRDISRRRVQQAFSDAFRYALTVNPLTYGGPVVEKAEHDGSHGWRVLVSPRSAVPGKVYERMVDNVIGNEVEDVCITVVGRSLPLAYRKRRPAEDRFSSSSTGAVLIRVEDAATADERERILRMTADIGLDWGEVDTLRDNATGALYVCGVNKTPLGPPEALGFSQQLRAVRMLAQAFKSEFLS